MDFADQHAVHAKSHADALVHGSDVDVRGPALDRQQKQEGDEIIRADRQGGVRSHDLGFPLHEFFDGIIQIIAIVVDGGNQFAVLGDDK